MYKDVGKKILAVMLCICMLVGMGTVSNFSSRADGEDVSAQADAGVSAQADAGVSAQADAGISPQATGVTVALKGNRPSHKVYNRGRSYGISLSDLEITVDGAPVTGGFYIEYGTFAGELGPSDKPTVISGEPTDAGQYYCHVLGETGSGYAGRESDNWVYLFNIYAIGLDAPAISWTTNGGVEARDSGDITPAEMEALITGIDNGEKLVQGTDYEYKCEVIGDRGLAVPGNRVVVTLTGKGNYQSTKVIEDIYVIPTSFKGKPVAATDKVPWGQDVEMTLNLKVVDPNDESIVIDPSTYTVHYYRNEACTSEIDPKAIKDVGTYWYTVSSANTSAVKGSFTVVKDLMGNYPANEGFGFSLEKDFYPFVAGEKPEPKVTVIEYLGSYDRYRVLEEDKDYEVEYAGNDVAGRGAMAIVTGKGNYAGSGQKFLYFQIEQVNLGSDRVRVEIDPEKCVYGGNIDGTGIGAAILPDQNGALTVSYYSEDGQKLADITNQCNFTYTNNDRVGEASVRITPKDTSNDNYTGEKVVTFNIGRRPLDIVTPDGIEAITATLVTEDGNDVYDGNPHRLKAIVMDGVVELRRDRDFTYSDADVTNARDEVSVVLHGIGNYSGTKTVSFKLNAAELLGHTTYKFKNGAEYEYTGSILLPEKDLEVVYTDPKTGEETTLQLMRDFDVKRVANNINAGQATAKIVGMGNYQGEITITYNIIPKKIGDDTDHLPTADMNAYFTDNGPYYYNGKAYTPGVAVRYNRLNVPEMVEGRDYTVSYTSVTEVGEQGQVSIQGNGNYQGTIILKYEVSPLDITNRVEVRVPQGQDDKVGTLLSEISYPYSGSPVEIVADKQSAIVNIQLDDGTTRRLGATEFEITYENNSQIGTATALITGTGNYTGTARVEFKIKGSLGDADRARIVLDRPTYNGMDIALDETLVVSATYRSSTGVAQNIVYGKDFTIEPVAGADYKNAGLAPVKICSTPTGDYTGEKTMNVEIQRKPLGTSGIEITVKPQTYRGFAYTAENIAGAVEGTFTNGLYNEKLELADPDQYTISFGDGVNTTDATGDSGVAVTIQAVGSKNFIGRTTARMVIEPLDITDALTIGTKKATYPVISDPAKITVADLNLNLRADFKSKYETAYSTAANPVKAEDMLAGLLTPEAGTSVLYRMTEDGEIANRADSTEAELVYDAIGEFEIYLEGTGNYTGVVTGDIKIVGNLAGGATGDNPVTSLRYRGQEYFAGATDPDEQIAAYYIAPGRDVDPEPEVYYLGKKLTVNVDYTLQYKGARNDLTKYVAKDNTPKITITGIGDYASGSFDVDYRVVPCDLSDTEYTNITIEGLEGLIYAARPLTPNISVKNDGTQIPNIDIQFANNVEGHQCSIDCAENNYKNCPTVTITPKEGNEYYIGTLVRYFDIRGIELNPDNYDIRISDEYGYPFNENTSYPFTGETIAPGVQVHVKPKEGVVGEERDLVLGKDFELVYRDADDEDVNPFHAGAYNICIVGKNNYSGVVKQAYSITPKNIYTNPNIQIVFEDESRYDGGNDVMPNLQIVDTERQDAAAPANVSMFAMLASTREDSYYKLVDKAKVEEGYYDYAMETVVDDRYNNKDAYASSNKMGAVQIVAEGDYTGQMMQTYPIGQYVLQDGDPYVSIEVADQTYTGGSLTPDVKVMLGTNVLDPADYTLEYKDNVNVGRAKVTITGAQRNLTGSYTAEAFAIAGKNLTTGVIIEPIGPQPLRNGAATPDPVVKDGNITLVKDVDYTLTYANNTLIGNQATVFVNGIGNYSDTISAEFTVVADIAAATVTPGEFEPQIYTGEPITPEITSLQINHRTLTRDVDYEVSYLNNVEPGTATILITGLGVYGGTKEINFEIYRDIDDTLTISALGQDYIYTGDPIEPLTNVPGSVTSGNNVLVENVDYTLSYENNVNVGTATVTVNGTGKYSGSVTREFNIIRRSMAQCQAGGIADVTYNGNNATPGVAVTYNNKALVENTDYTLVYLNNEKPGQARVLINGQGNFSGCKVVTFNIHMAGVSGARGQAASGTKINLNWSGADSVTGYEIYVGNQRIARISGTSYSISGLTPKTTYTYRIRAYTIRGGQVFYSDYTNVSVTTN